MSDPDPTSFFERLYTAAAAGEAEIPWDRDGDPHPLIAEWARDVDGAGRRALVVGSGLGGDAELIARRGFDVVAFDGASTAIAMTRQRFPDSRVDYRVADLLSPPSEWSLAFDLVVESLTVQSMPIELHARAIDCIAGFVAPGGLLLVIATARDEADGPVDGPPWPLTRDEVESFATGGLEAAGIELLRAPGVPRRWTRSSPGPRRRPTWRPACARGGMPSR